MSLFCKDCRHKRSRPVGVDCFEDVCAAGVETGAVAPDLVTGQISPSSLPNCHRERGPAGRCGVNGILFSPRPPLPKTWFGRLNGALRFK